MSSLERDLEKSIESLRKEIELDLKMNKNEITKAIHNFKEHKLEA
jgi:hypothetical protein